MLKLFKKKESNNSVKVLLKKLKRHDTKVVAVAVIIALFLSGGLIYISTPIVATTATEGIAESASQSNKETAEKLTEINKYLTDLDKVVTSNQKSLSAITGEDGKETTTAKETITETGKTTNTINKKVIELGGTLGDVHTKIESTSTKIEDLKKKIDDNEITSKEQIEKEFASVNEDITKIQTAYEDAKKQNKDLIDKLEKEISDGDKKLGEDASENHKALLAELESMGLSMEENNTTINNQFTTMTTTVNTGFDDIKMYLDNMTSSMNSRLDQVFQRVSDGKKLLASALLTKGVEIDEDATFTEISEAIINMPTTITVQQMGGEVVYDKHYHTDGNGTECNLVYVPIDRKGGCYEKAYYHVHSSDCYKENVYYDYLTDQSTHRHERVRMDYQTPIYRYTCDYCHSSFASSNGEHREFAATYDDARRRNGNTIKRVVKQVLVCGKDLTTLEGYSCSCGYLHGQILAAHIDYSMNKNLTSLPDLEESHIALPLEPVQSTELFDSLMQLTDYDMNYDSFEEGKDNALEESSFDKEGKEPTSEETSVEPVEEASLDSSFDQNEESGPDEASNEASVDNIEETAANTGEQELP